MASFEQARVAGLVLAAGFSRRLGRPKQLVELAGETLVARAARVAAEAGLKPVIVVLHPGLLEEGPGGFAGLGSLVSKCNVVVNEEAAEGMASSIRCGLGALRDEDLAGAVLMTCDQVAVTAAHLRALCAELAETVGSGYAGKVGVPAYFPVSRFAELRALRGDEGARALLRGARCVPTEALALDVDTEEELVRAEMWMREQSTGPD